MDRPARRPAAHARAPMLFAPILFALVLSALVDSRVAATASLLFSGQ